MNADRWTLLGAPWDCSGTGRGERLAPEALRAAGLSKLVSRDLGDVATWIDSDERDQRTGVVALRETVHAARTLADALTAALLGLPEQRPLVVGGDCSVLLGIFPALRRTLGAAGRRAATWLADVGPGVWLHLDLDVLDPGALPAVTYPIRGGPDWEQLSAALRQLTESPRLLGISVADFRPDLDPTGALVVRVLDLLEQIL